MEYRPDEERMESKEGRDIHELAEKEREHGDLFTALELCDKAASVYARDNDHLGHAEVLSSKVLAYRHLARRRNDHEFLILAEETAKEAVKMSEKAGIEATVLPLFNLAKVQEELGNTEEAVVNYRKSAERPLPIRHNLPAVRADIQVHLAACEYKLGDKDALIRAEEWLRKLKDSDHPDDYSKNVWISGGHMKIADAVKKDDKDLALNHMNKAREIIDTDPRKFVLQHDRWNVLFRTI